MIKNLGFCIVCAQCVPHQLSPEHALDFLERYERDGKEISSRTVTGDETQAHHFIPNIKKKSMV